MTLNRRTLLTTLSALSLPGLVAGASTHPETPEPWPEVLANLPQARWCGAGQMRYFGLQIYNAQLWVGPGFRASAYARAALALSLTYKRRLVGSAIAKSSLDEMRRQGPIPAEQASAWLSAMQAVFVDVADHDRLTGLHQPGEGARFWFNGRPLGEIPDPVFSQRFFGIWLGTATSQPNLRLALLSGASTAR